MQSAMEHFDELWDAINYAREESKSAFIQERVYVISLSPLHVIGHYIEGEGLFDEWTLKKLETNNQ